jgi:hypothetical protein
MRYWLSLCFLAPALLAQMQDTPLTPNGIQNLQRQTILLQALPNQQQYFQKTQEPPPAQRSFWQAPQAPSGDPNYWNLRPTQSPERFPAHPAPQKRKLFFFTGNPTPKPLKITARGNGKTKCSMPVIYALKGKLAHLDNMTIQVPGGNFSRDVIPPPAPPCDDWK